MTPLQVAAWQDPFLNGDKLRVPLIEHPRKGWRVGLSINL